MSDERNERNDERAALDPPPTEEEKIASSRLRDALEDPSLENPDADLARALRAAWMPEPLSAESHRELAEDAALPEEVEVARELREALADPSRTSSAADLARALSAAWAPKPLDEAEHRKLVEEALRALPQRRGRTVVRVAFGLGGAGLALAASVLVYLSGSPASEELPLARARSTQDLFTEPFRTGEASARIDRIALARASDFRDNRFAKWGVR